MALFLRDLISSYSIAVCFNGHPFYGDLFYKDLFYRDLFYKDLSYRACYSMRITSTEICFIMDLFFLQGRIRKELCSLGIHTIRDVKSPFPLLIYSVGALLHGSFL